MTNGLHIIQDWYRIVDDEQWLRFVPGKDVTGRAEDIAARYADTTQARAFLTRSIVTLNKEGMRRKAGGTFGWVPDRSVGELVAFGFPGGVTFRSAQEATPEAYIAQNPSRFADRACKVVEYDTDIFQCPAGPTAFVSTVQRERRTTFMTLTATTVTFPPVEGLNEATAITLFSTRLDAVGQQAGRFVRMMANSLAVKIQRPDGTTFTVGPWEE